MLQYTDIQTLSRSYIADVSFPISNIIENPIMYLANGYISIMYVARACLFSLFRDIYMLPRRQLASIGIDLNVHDFGQAERVLRVDRRIDRSFQVTQLSTVCPLYALSSRLDLREFQCPSSSRQVYRYIGKSAVLFRGQRILFLLQRRV